MTVKKETQQACCHRLRPLPPLLAWQILNTMIVTKPTLISLPPRCLQEQGLGLAMAKTAVSKETKQAQSQAQAQPQPQAQSQADAQAQAQADAQARAAAQHAKAKQAQEEYQRLQHHFAQLQQHGRVKGPPWLGGARARLLRHLRALPLALGN